MEVTIDLEAEDRLYLDIVDVDVRDPETLAFRIEGRISGLDPSTLEAVAGQSLEPTAVTFTTN